MGKVTTPYPPNLRCGPGRSEYYCTFRPRKFQLITANMLSILDRRIAWISFWAQLALSIVSSFILFFALSAVQKVVFCWHVHHMAYVLSLSGLVGIISSSLWIVIVFLTDLFPHINKITANPSWQILTLGCPSRTGGCSKCQCILCTVWRDCIFCQHFHGLHFHQVSLINANKTHGGWVVGYWLVFWMLLCSKMCNAWTWMVKPGFTQHA